MPPKRLSRAAQVDQVAIPAPKKARTNEDNDDEVQVLSPPSPAAASITNARLDLGLTAQFFVTFEDGSHQWVFGSQLARYLDKAHEFLVSLEPASFELLAKCQTDLVRDLMGIASQQRQLKQSLKDAMTVQTNEQPAIGNSGSINATGIIKFWIVDFTRRKTSFKMKRNTTLDKIAQAFAAREALDQDVLHFWFNARRVNGHETLADLELKDEDEILVARKGLHGSHPMIHLYPARAIDCTVEVNLADEWEFTHLYPDTSHSQSNKIVWKVNASKTSDLIVYNHIDPWYPSALSWEAAIKATTIGKFFALYTRDTMTIPRAKFCTYLPDKLDLLRLSPTQRDKMISHWWPKMSTLKNLAFRFLAQDEINKMAPITITPRPDIIHRVFLIFGEGKESEAMPGKETDWARVVENGANMTGWKAGKFSVLECGAMLIE